MKCLMITLTVPNISISNAFSHDFNSVKHVKIAYKQVEVESLVMGNEFCNIAISTSHK